MFSNKIYISGIAIYSKHMRMRTCTITSTQQTCFGFYCLLFSFQFPLFFPFSVFAIIYLFWLSYLTYFFLFLVFNVSHFYLLSFFLFFLFDHFFLVLVYHILVTYINTNIFRKIHLFKIISQIQKILLEF